jgi:DNA-binding HxlR family transcriptional regulator
MTSEGQAICNPQEQRSYFRAINLLNEKWVLHILSVLMQGPIGFNELARMAQNVNTKTLSQRLQLLESEGVVKRTVQSSIPPKTSYELTAKGQAIRPILLEIRAWALEHTNSDTADCAPTSAKIALSKTSKTKARG